MRLETRIDRTGRRPAGLARLATGFLALLLFVPSLPASAAPSSPLVDRGLRQKAARQGSVRVMVQMKSGLSGLSRPSGPPARGAGARALGEIEHALAGRPFAVAREFRTIPVVALEVSPEALDALAASGTVERVVEDRLEKPMLDESSPMVQADLLWEAGTEGDGWAIAVLDTGVDAAHPFLVGKVVDEACFSANGSCPNGQREQFGPGAAAPCSFAPGACGHGTHVAGIAAGRGSEASGVARGAPVMAIQVFSRFSGDDICGDGEDPCARSYNSDTLAALEYVYERRQEIRVAAANLSLGGDLYATQAACDADDPGRLAIVQALRSVGIATVAASGNEGRANQVSAPGCLSGVVSVGAVTKQDAIASFSDAAPFLSLLAPGYQIGSSIPGGRYAVISGTSQATPHVAGAFALLYDHMGTADVSRALEALQSTGLPLLDSRNGLTFRRILVRDAAGAIGEPVTPGSGLQITPDGKHTLISKDVGGERWALATTGDVETVTGNVFQPDGGAPVFLWCDRTARDGNPDAAAEIFTFACQVAGDCNSDACPAGQWNPAGSVELPGSFFLPREGEARAAASVSSAAPMLEAPAADPPSALQVTPDSRATLVSKTVNGQRWSIARNADDLTVTGNVYSTDGRDPQFVHCTFQGASDSSPAMLSYACSVADRCVGGGCTLSDWNYFADVSLPETFFEPR